MICINKSNKDFKKLARECQVSINDLEFITYKYYIETGTIDMFPSKTYIKNNLGAGQYEESSDIIREAWDKWYSKPRKFKSEKAFQVIKKEAESFFPAKAVISYTDDKGNKILMVKKPVKRIELKQREDFETLQDFEDYCMDLGRPVPQSSSTGSHIFTFNDGTQVRAPFEPNSQQENALNVMSDFIKSNNENVMTLAGYAGTGKTSLMELIAQKANREFKNIIFSAATNKAAMVLKERVGKAGFDASTLHKIFGIVVAEEGEQYDASNTITARKEDRTQYDSVVVIDEASMINDEAYDIINNIAKQKKLKIIYVGDPAQLPKIEKHGDTGQLSKVFTDQDIRRVTLTKVERTGDNAILKEATSLRSGEGLSGESSFNKNGQGVAYIKYSNKENVEDIIKEFAPHLKQNPEFFRILAYHNAAVTRYNELVRNALGYNDLTPRVGEPIMGYTNWGYIWDPVNPTYKFINSESYNVVAVFDNKVLNWQLDNGETISLLAVPIKIENPLGHQQVVNFIDIRANEINKRNALKLAKEKARLWKEAFKYPAGSKQRTKLLQQKNAIEEFLFVNDNIIDTTTTVRGKHPLLQKKVFDFGYAMTTHKSQGSTFTHVLVDDVDIASAKEKGFQDFQDVALSDTDQEIVDIDYDLLDDGEEVDLGIPEEEIGSQTLINEVPNVSPTEGEDLTMRQRLEYVAVSRATDTVTVLASDKTVKKEDSPLNHVNLKDGKVSEKVPEVTSQPAAKVVKQAPVTLNTKPEKPISTMTTEDVWEHVSKFYEPMGGRPITYSPEGKPTQSLTVRDGHIYDKDGNLVHETNNKKNERNRILANLAIVEDRAVVVESKGKKYVVDNHKNITSTITGKLMGWDEKNGDRRDVLNAAANKFRELIEIRQKRNNEIMPQIIGHYEMQGIPVHDRAELIEYLSKKGSNNIQEAIETQKEMQEIKEKALADGTFMKAPNGKDTNLTERQWLQVRTKAFKNWFGDWINDPSNASKVVDENGEPLVVYHSGAHGINIFRGDKYGLSYFGDSATSVTYPGTEYKVFLNIRNPQKVKGNGEEIGDITEKKFGSRRISPSQNQDGVIYSGVKDVGEGIYEWDYEDINLFWSEYEKQGYGTVYAVSNPNQIKSATDNNGEFSIENPDIMKYTTPEGEVYGFLDPKGEMYVDETVASSDHLLHEGSHLWDRVVAARNPRLWKKGISLFKSPKLKVPGHEKSLWQEIEDSDNYGKKWKKAGISGYSLDSLIASEVHARTVGPQGEALLNSIARKKGSENIISKLKQWILDFWKELKSTFGNWTDEELDELTIDKINQMTIRDLVEGNIFRQGGEEGSGQYQSMTPEMRTTLDKINAYDEWQDTHIQYVDETHEYFFDGEKIDYSVTEYGEKIYGKKEFTKDYSHSSAIGLAADAMYRDFFQGKDVTKVSYPNMNESRKKAVLEDLNRLKAYFDKVFDGQYYVITKETRLAGRISTAEGDKTIAGTMDMVIVDKNGDKYILDMKAKNHPITRKFNGIETDRRTYTFQLNGYRQLNDAIFPEDAGRVKGLFLIWMDTAYPQQGEGVTFTTDKRTKLVSVTEDGSVAAIPLENYSKWKTPALKENVADSLIGLVQSDYLHNVRPIDKSWREENATKEENIDINKISDKTAAYGVVVKEIKNFKDAADIWKRNNPEGIVAYRKFGQKPESFTSETIEEDWIGNPFSGGEYGFGPKTVQRFYEWIVTGNNFGNEKATEASRRAIVKKLNEAPLDTPVLYYKELDRPSHATVIGYLINNKHLLEDTLRQISDAEVEESSQFLKITPVQKADKKAEAKGSISNKFIGYAEGIENSSTAAYAEQAGDKANTGEYSSEDVVFVSVPGMGGNITVRHEQQDKTIQEALEALKAGATLVTDDKAYAESNSYNEGEKKLATELKKAGAIYSEKTVKGEKLGIWKLLMEVRDDLRKEKQPASTTNAALEQFKQGIETLSGYFEGGGRHITDDFVGLKQEPELIDKLNNHFMGGEELTIEDYRKLWNYVKVEKNTDPNIVDTPYIAVPKKNIINPEESRSTKDGQFISATIAPYFNTSYEDYINMAVEEQKKMREAFSAAAKKIADLLGIVLDIKQTSFNIGGYQYESGDSIVEPSFTFRLNTTPEKARLFAALMGDLGYEQQEATISSYRVDSYDEADGVKYFIKYNNLDALLDLLNKYEIKNFTFDKTRGELSVLSFDDADLNKFKQLVTDLNNNKNGEEFEIQTEPFKSSYDERGDRKLLYEEWDKNLREEQGREGYNSELHSIIQEALEKVTSDKEASEEDTENPFDTEEDKVGPTPVPTLAPVFSQEVSLPEFEYFSDAKEATKVDAEWKIEVLQDLEKELKDLHEKGNNEDVDRNKLIKQMGAVLVDMNNALKAPTKEDYYKISSPEKKAFEKRMTEYWRRNIQINNLINNEVGLKATEVREVAETVIDSISDLVTDIQNEPSKIKELFPMLSISKDLANASRKEIIQAIGLNNLIEKARENFENLMQDDSNPEVFDLYDSDAMRDQAWLVLDNWDAIIELGNDIFAQNEGFGIRRNTKDAAFEVIDKKLTAEDIDDSIGYKDADDTREEEDEQEQWQVKQLTVDLFNSMTELMKQALHNCYELDKNENKVRNKWGIFKRVNKVTAFNNLLYWTRGCLSLSDMIEALSKQKARKPWVKQLIDRLEDSSGKEADFQSQFYSTMRRHKQLYDNIKEKKGTYSVTVLNGNTVLKDVVSSIVVQFQLNEHPLFSRKGLIRKKELEDLTQWYNELNQLVNKLGIEKSSDGIYSIENDATEDDYKKAVQIITGASRMLGYMVDESTVENAILPESLYEIKENLRYITQNLGKQIANNSEAYDPFNADMTNNIRGKLTNFLKPLVEELEENVSGAFFEEGNMYQINVTPSFLTQLFDQFKQNPEKFDAWVSEFYGQSEWFYDKKEGIYKLPILQALVSNPELRSKFDHKIQLNFNKHEYMTKMSPEEYTLSAITEYFSEYLAKDVSATPAWVRVPLQSNKPSSEFIKLPVDKSANYKQNIVDKLYKMFLQELERIDTVRKGNRQKGDPSFIDVFDEKGRTFCFLPFLNSYLIDNGKTVNEIGDTLLLDEEGNIDKEKNNKLKKLLNRKLSANESEKLNREEERELTKLVKEATMNHLQTTFDSVLAAWEKSGILTAASKVQGIKSLGRNVKENLENFLWNDFYTANSILQLTIVDKAFYPNATEMQKRLAELHSPGRRGNKDAVDYNGDKVSDGYYRTIVIKDYEDFTANIIENIAEVFNKMIENAPKDDIKGLRALKDYLVGKNGVYRKINVTDGQGYSSPTSYRKKAFMFGKWSREAEELYNKILDGTATLAELKLAFQPLKPFVYGWATRDIGTGYMEGNVYNPTSTIQKMPVPYQAKNSEYLLIMADALIRKNTSGRPNILKAIFDVMEDSAFTGRKRDAEGNIIEKGEYNGFGIDTIQFESAIKSGKQTPIDLSPWVTKPGGERAAYKYMMSLINQDNANDDKTNYTYNQYVTKLDYDYYSLQQEVPAHFRDHSQLEASQQRMNIPADLEYYTLDGDINMYHWVDPNTGEKHEMDAKQIRKEYEEVHADNIKKGLEAVTKKFHLDSADRKERNLALSEILQEEIMSSPRYGLDLFLACQIDPKTGEFRIPKGDPIQSKRIEQLINSLIKSEVNKQKVSGGPIVQVTNFGASHQLHIRFTDKKETNGVIQTKEEFDAAKAQGEHEEYKDYTEYCKDRQGGIAHFEVLAPIGMKATFERFKNPDGTLNMEAIEKCDPNLLKLITSRIPNEDKYSIAHAKIVGFLPAWAGEAIMFPYELTQIDDSDFDVDKRYCMQMVMRIVEDRAKVEKSLYNKAVALYKASTGKEPKFEDKKKINDVISILLDNPEKMRHNDKLYERLYDEYQKVLKEEFPWKTVYPKEGTEDANNNKIIAMSWTILSNEMIAPQILNPGGFEVQKHTAYTIAAYKRKRGKDDWDTLSAMDTKELKRLAALEMDLARFDHHVQFYKQNAAGSNLIGVFAVNKTAHAILCGDNIYIAFNEICGETPLTIGDQVFSGMILLDPEKDTKGERIGKGIGSGIGASADTAKDPWLDIINVNMSTAGTFNAMLRMKMPFEDAELFMAQDIIAEVLSEFNKRNLLEKKNVSLKSIIKERLKALAEKYGYTEDTNSEDDSEIYKNPLTKKELLEGLLVEEGEKSSDRDAIDFKVLRALSKMIDLAKEIKKPTFVTRFNSMKTAAGPLIIDNLILEHKLQEFLLQGKQESTGFYVEDGRGKFEIDGKRYSVATADTILNNHPILKQFSRAVDTRYSDCPIRLLFSDMPAGSTLFKTLLEGDRAESTIDTPVQGLPENIKSRIYDDRQLLSKLSDFFQSYMLVASGVIKPEQLRNLIDNLPAEIAEIQKQYPDNAFVQALTNDYDRKTNKVFVNVKTTGMKEQEKQVLKIAWLDLHKVNPELSKKLFTYAFFRGGIGFNPKSFMSLAGYIKEYIPGYVDTYRNFPYLHPDIVIDQFIRNYWDNNTLVPWKGGEGTNYEKDLKGGNLYVRNDKDKADLAGIVYMKTKEGNEVYLWKLLGNESENSTTRHYVKVDALGNNGEYLEMSTDENMKASKKTTIVVEKDNVNDISTTSPAELEDASTDRSDRTPSAAEQGKNVFDIIQLIMDQSATTKSNPYNTRDKAMAHFERLRKMVNEEKAGKEAPQGIKEYTRNLFRRAGVELDADKAWKEFKKYC